MSEQLPKSRRYFHVFPQSIWFSIAHYSAIAHFTKQLCHNFIVVLNLTGYQGAPQEVLEDIHQSVEEVDERK